MKIFRIAVAAAILGSGALYADWGADDFGDDYRPKTSWLKRFHNTPDVVATDSINDAINRCDEVVGEDKYCVVAVPGGVLKEPVEIFRWRTKLVSADGKPIEAKGAGTMFYIGDDTRYVAIDGLKIKGTDVGDDGIYAIIVEGKSIRYVAITNNEIYDFSTDNGNAHAIGIYGTGGESSESIRHILISGNTIHDMRTGSSESIALNGNVIRFQIDNNDIYDINNIAIDIIGGEGTSPTREKNGRVIPGKYDAARYGYVEDNFVENLSTANNPAYDNKESWAAAIYIDGGRYVKVVDNVIQKAAWGYEIGAENCMVTRHIIMYGNSAEESYFGDLTVGGYNHKGFYADKSIECDPTTDPSDEGHGYVRHITIYDNDFATQDPAEENIHISYRTTYAIIEQDGVEAVNDDDDGSAKGDENAIKTSR